MNNKLIRIKGVMDLTGLARSTVYKYISLGHFPKPVKHSTRSVAWVESEITEWINDCIKRRDEEEF